VKAHLNRGAALLCIGLPMVALFAGGCQNKSGGVPTSGSALDVSTPAPYTPASYSAPAYSAGPSATAAPIQPVYDSAPPMTSVTPAYNSGSGFAGGGSYVVKKGDTLYGIARAHYGDGKQWQKIMAANPGVSPSSLKVGQTLTLP
jgi:5'-nucleotidase